MATLTVWKFDTPDGAQKAEEALAALQKQELIKVLDAATVSWEEGKQKPQPRQATSRVSGVDVLLCLLLCPSLSYRDAPTTTAAGRARTGLRPEP